MWRRMVIVWIAAACLVGACSSSDGSSLPDTTAPSVSASTGPVGPTFLTEVTVVGAVPDEARRAFRDPGDAAIFAAQTHRAGLHNARVTRMVAIYADDTAVDLRVEVTADGFCHWYGVDGRVERGALEWRAGPAGPCDG